MYVSFLSVTSDQSLEEQGFAVHSWDELVAQGKESPVEPPSRPKAEDLCTIMYTSGTTGGWVLAQVAYTCRGIASTLQLSRNIF